MAGCGYITVSVYLISFFHYRHFKCSKSLFNRLPSGMTTWIHMHRTFYLTDYQIVGIPTDRIPWKPFSLMTIGESYHNKHSYTWWSWTAFWRLIYRDFRYGFVSQKNGLPDYSRLFVEIYHVPAIRFFSAAVALFLVVLWSCRQRGKVTSITAMIII